MLGIVQKALDKPSCVYVHVCACLRASKVQGLSWLERAPDAPGTNRGFLNLSRFLFQPQPDILGPGGGLSQGLSKLVREEVSGLKPRAGAQEGGHCAGVSSSPVTLGCPPSLAGWPPEQARA